MRRLRLTDADKPTVLMVGDRKYDVLGAQECGLACVGVEFFGYAAPGELAEAGAAAVVRTAEEPDRPLLVHAVQQILHPPVLLDAWPDADRRSRLVLIVKDIEEDTVQRLWDAFLGRDSGQPTGRLQQDAARSA